MELRYLFTQPHIGQRVVAGLARRQLTITRVTNGEGDDLAEVSGRCFVTDKPYSVVAPMQGLDRWLSGQIIQVALADLSEEDREFLISRTSPEGWALMVQEEE